MERSSVRFGARQLAIILLAVITAAIHIWLAVARMNNDPIFILNGLGYLALTAALFLDIEPLRRYRNLIRWLFIGYTALTFLLWVFIGEREMIAYIDKAVELVLIVLLWLDTQ